MDDGGNRCALCLKEMSLVGANLKNRPAFSRMLFDPLRVSAFRSLPWLRSVRHGSEDFGILCLIRTEIPVCWKELLREVASDCVVSSPRLNRLLGKALASSRVMQQS